MTYYLDSSGAVKLVKPEPETKALSAFLRQASGRLGSQALLSADIIQTELIGASLRAGVALREPMRVLGAIRLVRVSARICESAGLLVGEFGLRSLDAIHLAVAMEHRSSLLGVITYDTRFAEAATTLGFPVEAPA